MARVRTADARAHAFHEAPLVVFTALSVMGAGVGAAHLVGALLGFWSLSVSRPVALLLTTLMAAGFLVSAGHLGRPLRGMRALRRVGTSPLSREVVAVGATVGLGVACVLLPAGADVAPWLGLLLSAASLATLLSLGAVYRLAHQLAWRGPTVMHPLVLGALSGWVVLSVLGGGAVDSGGAVPAWTVLGALLTADVALWLLRVQGWSSARSDAEAHHRWGERSRTPLILGRLLLGTLAPVALLLAGAASWALLSLTLGVLVDRLAFYALALRRSTEAEVARVEALL